MKIISVYKILKEDASAGLAANAAKLDTMRSNSEHGLRQLGINPNTQQEDGLKKTVEIYFATNEVNLQQHALSKFMMPRLVMVVSREQDSTNNKDAIVTMKLGSNAMQFKVIGLKEKMEMSARKIYPIKMLKVKGSFERNDDATYSRDGVNLPKVDKLDNTTMHLFTFIRFETLVNTTKYSF
jgi:hypothetical protein